MLTILVSVNAAIFFALGAIHSYWLVGGKWGLSASLPYNPATQNFVFRPSIMATLVVGFGLFLFALITLGNANVFSFGIDERYFRYGDMFISIVFLIRAVGEFKYVGFFKSIRGTTFAKMDSRYYSPLCLLLSVVGILIYYLA